MNGLASATVDARGVALLTLNRANKRNALSAALIDDVQRAAESLATDDAVRVVVLTGAGATFCAGGDLGWMRDQMAADDTQRAAEATRLANMLGTLNDLPKPLIGALQGDAFGGGVGLACVCDVAIGVTGAKFGLTEVRLGLIPATIGPYVIARMGAAKARRVIMSGRVFGAAEAVNLGILATAVAPEHLAAAVEAEITPYLSAAPGAVAAAKQLVRELGSAIDDVQISQSIAALVRQWQSPEAAEGIDAFFGKRAPDWKGK